MLFISFLNEYELNYRFKVVVRTTFSMVISTLINLPDLHHMYLTDDNECDVDGICGEGYETHCRNTPGSYVCVCDYGEAWDPTTDECTGKMVFQPLPTSLTF